MYTIANLHFNQPYLFFSPQLFQSFFFNQFRQPRSFFTTTCISNSTTNSANHFPLSQYNQLSQLIFNNRLANHQPSRPTNFILIMQPHFLAFLPHCNFFLLVRLRFLLQSLRGSSVEDHLSLVIVNSITY